MTLFSVVIALNSSFVWAKAEIQSAMLNASAISSVFKLVSPSVRIPLDRGRAIFDLYVLVVGNIVAVR